MITDFNTPSINYFDKVERHPDRAINRFPPQDCFPDGWTVRSSKRRIEESQTRKYDVGHDELYAGDTLVAEILHVTLPWGVKATEDEVLGRYPELRDFPEDANLGYRPTTRDPVAVEAIRDAVFSAVRQWKANMASAYKARQSSVPVDRARAAIDNLKAAKQV